MVFMLLPTFMIFFVFALMPLFVRLALVFAFMIFFVFALVVLVTMLPFVLILVRPFAGDLGGAGGRSCARAVLVTTGTMGMVVLVGGFDAFDAHIKLDQLL